MIAEIKSEIEWHPINEFYGYYINKSGQVLDWKGVIHEPRLYKYKKYPAVPINILDNTHTKRVSTVYRYVHILLQKYVYSTYYTTCVIDHINQDKTNFNYSNLRLISQSKNAKNRNFGFTIIMKKENEIIYKFHNYVNVTDVLGINDEAPEYYEFKNNIKKLKDSGMPLIINNWNIYMCSA